MQAADLLTTAASLVQGERRQDHGPAEQSFGAIARTWSCYLNNSKKLLAPITASEAAMMLALFKTTRAQCGRPIPDHYVDAAGYVGLAGELSTGEKASLPDSALERALAEVKAELERAQAKFPPFRSAHEGLSIIEEEISELSQEVRRKDVDRTALRMEAIQVASMAIRMVLDCCDN